MDTIKLPEGSVAEMRQFYQDEFEKTLKRLQHIKSVLDNLGGSHQTIRIEVTSAPVKSENKAAGKKQPATVEKKTKKSRPGRKSIWEELIVNQLKKNGKPTSYKDLTNEIMKYGNIPEKKRESTKRAITNLIFRLKKQNKILRTIPTGSREKLIVLKAWFDSNGEIKEQYK